MIFHQFFVSALSSYSYLLADRNTRQAIVVDPTRDILPYMEMAWAEGVEIIAILETHVHADFVSGAKDLKQALEGKPLIYASKMGGEAWTPHYVDHPVGDGDEIQLGNLRIQARHTPGHTPEHLIWLCYDKTRSNTIPWFIFTGDLLFVGGVGRPDLLGGEALETLSKQLYQSLFTTLAEFPDFVEIYPAHGAGSLCGKGMSDRATSTLGYERQFNPSLKPLPEAAWIARLLHQMPAAPRHFQQVKRINVEGSSNKLHKIAELEKPTGLVIDTRDPLKFAAGHYPGALNIPLGSSFCDWAAMLIPEDQPLFLVVPPTVPAQHVAGLLHLIGFDSITGYSELGGTEKWTFLKPAEVVKEQIIDVRTPAEWNAGHIEGAQHIELARLPAALQEISQEKPLALICGSGYRSSAAASWLKSKGFTHVASITGGMQAWRQSNLPIIKGDL